MAVNSIMSVVSSIYLVSEMREETRLHKPTLAIVHRLDDFIGVTTLTSKALVHAQKQPANIIPCQVVYAYTAGIL